MTVGELLEILTSYDIKEYVEIEIYDNETGKYIDTDENPTVDRDGLDLVFQAKIKK